MFNTLLQSFVSRLIVAMLSFAVLVVSAKYLGVVTRGEISLFLFNIALIQLFAEVFSGYHLLHFLNRYNPAKIYNYGILFVLSICTIGNGVLWIAGKLIEGYEWKAFFITILVALNTFHCVMVLGVGKVQLYYKLSLLQPALLFGLLIVFVYSTAHLTLDAYLFPLLISFLLAAAVSYIKLRLLLNSAPKQTEFEMKPILKNGLAAQLALVMFLLGSKYSFYLLKPDAGLGIYAASLSITESVLLGVNALLPYYLSKIATEQKKEHISALTFKIIAGVLGSCLLALMLINLIPETVYLAILGKSFEGIGDSILFYSPSVLIMALYTILSNYFTGKGEARLVLISNAPGFLLTLFIYPWLLEQFHIRGAAMGTFLVFSMNTALLLYHFVRQNSWPLQTRS